MYMSAKLSRSGLATAVLVALGTASWARGETTYQVTNLTKQTFHFAIWPDDLQAGRVAIRGLFSKYQRERPKKPNDAYLRAALNPQETLSLVINEEPGYHLHLGLRCKGLSIASFVFPGKGAGLQLQGKTGFHLAHRQRLNLPDLESFIRIEGTSITLNQPEVAPPPSLTPTALAKTCETESKALPAAAESGPPLPGPGFTPAEYPIMGHLDPLEADQTTGFLRYLPVEIQNHTGVEWWVRCMSKERPCITQPGAGGRHPVLLRPWLFGPVTVIPLPAGHCLNLWLVPEAGTRERVLQLMQADKQGALLWLRYEPSTRGMVARMANTVPGPHAVTQPYNNLVMITDGEELKPDATPLTTGGAFLRPEAQELNTNRTSLEVLCDARPAMVSDPDAAERKSVSPSSFFR